VELYGLKQKKRINEMQPQLHFNTTHKAKISERQGTRVIGYRNTIPTRLRQPQLFTYRFLIAKLRLTENK